MVGVRGKSGRKVRCHDQMHKLAREAQRVYEGKQREAINLAAREKIPLAEARKRLGIKIKLQRQHGVRKKRV